MKYDPLTWLGCSSTLALLLAAPAQANTVQANTAQANTVANPAADAVTVREISFSAPDETVFDALGCTCTQSGLETMSPGYTSPGYADAEGDLAIASLGCDCAGCRNIIRQSIQSIPVVLAP